MMDHPDKPMCIYDLAGIGEVYPRAFTLVVKQSGFRVSGYYPVN